MYMSRQFLYISQPKQAIHPSHTWPVELNGVGCAGRTGSKKGKHGAGAGRISLRVLHWSQWRHLGCSVVLAFSEHFEIIRLNGFRARFILSRACNLSQPDRKLPKADSGNDTGHRASWAHSVMWLRRQVVVRGEEP